MMLSYFLRLLGLCFACFFVVNASAGLALSLFAPPLVSFSQRLRPKAAARLMFALLVFPAGLALGSVLFFCIPSYLWFEVSRNDEKVGALFIVTALLGLACSTRGAARASWALRKTARWVKRCMRPDLSSGSTSGYLVADVEQPIVALVGLAHPKIVISQSVLDGLTPAEIDAVLHHEMAHRAALDNWKRLALLLRPNPLPFWPEGSALKQTFLRCSEWSADDEAAQSDPARATDLASALVRVSRLKNLQSLAVASSLMQDGDDLRMRVQRLLQAEPLVLASEPHRPAAILAIPFAISALLYLSPQLLLAAHRLLEHLVQ